MPPKAKFSETEIINASLEIIETLGFDKLTARSLGEKLGSSPRPIFTVFSSMDEVYEKAKDAANDLYTEYVKKGLGEDIAFKGVGKSYVRFASEHPKLFRMLFMSEQNETQNINSILKIIEKNYDDILGSITAAYAVSKNEAKYLYRHMWIYTHGIAVLIATKVCAFSPEEISAMLTDIFTSLLKKIKTEKNK